jgi:putative endopeptidase
MKTLLGVLAVASAAATLGFSAPSLADDPSKPQIPPWGFDLAGRDPAIAPGADFYTYANGTYVKKLVIPPDRSRYGSFDALAALSETRVHDLLDKVSAVRDASGERAKVGAFYRAFMDQAHVDALGAAPLGPELARIRAANTRSAIARLMGEGVESFYGGIFGADIQVDEKDPLHYAVYLGQAGLGLPDRDYYLEPSFAAQKTAYVAYVAQMLKLAGWPDADAQAKAIVDMETQIAQASWSLAEQRDPTKTYNPMTPAELAAAAPGFDWAAFLDGAELGGTKRVVIAESTAFPKIAAIFAATPISTLQAWEAFNVADSGSGSSSSAARR